MPEPLGPSRIIIINSKRLYHPIRDMGRPELRIPPYIALHPPVHPCRDFRKIFSPKIPENTRKYPKIPETSRKDGAKIFPKKLRKVTVRFTRNPQNGANVTRHRIFRKNFSQFFFRKFFTKFFLQNRPKSNTVKNFLQNFFTKFFGATYPIHPHYFLTKRIRRFARDSRL